MKITIQIHSLIIRFIFHSIYRSKDSVFMSFNLKSAQRALKFATAHPCVIFSIQIKRGIRIQNYFIQIRAVADPEGGAIGARPL